MLTKTLTLLFISLITAQLCFAQQGPPIELPRVKGELIFDGKVDEAFWDEMEPLKLTMHIPNFGEEPTEKADVFLTYDNDYIYLTGRMFVSDSSCIRGTTYKRDAFDGTSDYFGLVIDSYNK